MKKILAFATFLILIAGCQKNETEILVNSSVYHPMDCYVGLKGAAIGQVINAAYLDKINEQLVASGVNYRIAMAELITAAGSGENGRTVYRHSRATIQRP